MVTKTMTLIFIMLSNLDKYNTFKIVAIDPGLNNIGVAIFHIQTQPFSILSIHAETLKEEKVLDEVSLDGEYFTERLIKRLRMTQALMKIIKEIHPCWVVSESPFFNRRTPGSFAVLTEVISGIFESVAMFDSNIRHATVEPLLVKHTLHIAGEKGKDVVRDAMSKENYLLSVLEQNLNELDEHAIDAIGVGYTFIKRKLGLERKDS